VNVVVVVAHHGNNRNWMNKQEVWLTQ